MTLRRAQRTRLVPAFGVVRFQRSFGTWRKSTTRVKLRATIDCADRHLIELRARIVNHLGVYGERPRIRLERVNRRTRECPQQRRGVIAMMCANFQDGCGVLADQLLQDCASDIDVGDGRDVACHVGRVSLLLFVSEALTRITQRSVYASRRLIGIRYSSVAGERPTNPLRTFVCINEV